MAAVFIVAGYVSSGLGPLSRAFAEFDLRTERTGPMVPSYVS